MPFDHFPFKFFTFWPTIVTSCIAMFFAIAALFSPEDKISIITMWPAITLILLPYSSSWAFTRHEYGGLSSGGDYAEFTFAGRVAAFFLTIACTYIFNFLLYKLFHRNEGLTKEKTPPR